MRPALALLLAAFVLSGCAVYDVASTTVGAAASMAGAAADVAQGAVCTIACSADDARK